MICPSCNTKNSEDARYCKRCGKKLPVYIDNDYTEDGFYQEIEDDDGSFLTKMLVAVTIVVVLMALTVVVFVMVRNHTRKKSVVVESTTEEPKETYVFTDPESIEDTEEEQEEDGNDFELGTTEEEDSDTEEDQEDESEEDETEEDDNTPMSKAEKYKDAACKAPAEFGGHAYAVFDYKDLGLKRSFNACEDYCEKIGGHLAVISSQEENDFLYDYVKHGASSYAFFGYTDQKDEGDWRWVDGSTSSYENWWKNGSKKENQPNNRNGKEHYAQFYGDKNDGSWCDARFGEGSRKFICEWE